MRNLTVFDGLAMITMSGGGNNSTVDVPISGFLTLLLASSTWSSAWWRTTATEVKAATGWGSTAAAGFEYISDATHDESNAFNSTHSNDGAMTPWRMPAFNNTLGHDASVFVPDNSGYDFLPNNATEAEIRVTTGGESITVQVITSVIDVYEPDLRATVYIEDLNGGVAEPGDILEYTVVGKNLGSDAAVDVYATTTLDIRTTFVEGSLEWVTPNAVVDMTDAVRGRSGRVHRGRPNGACTHGAGANGTKGDNWDNDPLGMDSVAYKYKVALTDDCMPCTRHATAEAADIYGAGNISGNDQTNDGASALVDENGCPVEEVTVLEVQTGVCPLVSIEPTGQRAQRRRGARSVPIRQQPLGAVSGQLHLVWPQRLCDGRPHGVHPRCGFRGRRDVFDGGDLRGTRVPVELGRLHPRRARSRAHLTHPRPNVWTTTRSTSWREVPSTLGLNTVGRSERQPHHGFPGLGVTGIQFNAGGWHDVTLTLEEIGCTRHVHRFGVHRDVLSGLVGVRRQRLPLERVRPVDGPVLQRSQPRRSGPRVDVQRRRKQRRRRPCARVRDAGHLRGRGHRCIHGQLSCLHRLCHRQLGGGNPNPPVGFLATPQIVDITNPVVTLESLVDSVNTVTYFGRDGGSLNAANGQYVFDNGGTFQLIQTVVSL